MSVAAREVVRKTAGFVESVARSDFLQGLAGFGERSVWPLDALADDFSTCRIRICMTASHKRIDPLSDPAGYLVYLRRERDRRELLE